jgi:hypothetical protein
MDVEIGELSSTVRAVDRNSILSPKTMDHILRVVLQAVRDDRDHTRRVQAEKKVSGGVSHEQAEERE